MPRHGIPDAARVERPVAPATAGATPGHRTAGGGRAAHLARSASVTGRRVPTSPTTSGRPAVRAD
ncbi:hypothetical protein ACIP6V_12210, partial [Streptomyces sp. NPDC088770]|uniref:hypothetical protein n=1 Tax=Streptomyces sp. NPDC088770 TaxID=3365895 RepID=UPI003817EBB2